MNDHTKTVSLMCDCGCCRLVFQKWMWPDGDTYYNVSVEDSRYDHRANGVLNRIRNAAKVLFGKSICYNDVSIDGEEHFEQLLRRLHRLREWDGMPVGVHSDDNLEGW